jgi:hypothetical protein
MAIMKIHELMLSLFLFIFSCYAFAEWQVAKPKTTTFSEPVLQAKPQNITAYVPPVHSRHVYSHTHVHHGTHIPAVYAVSISGSLKENIERIMHRYHWKVIWKAPYDYNFDGRVTGNNLPNVIEKLFQPFPLQAVMYMSNRTLAVLPRSKT